MRRRILAIPIVEDLDAFGRLVAHLGHYLGHVDPERVAVPVSDDLVDRARAWLCAPSLPKGFDGAVLARIEAIRDRIRLVGSTGDLDTQVRWSDLVLAWDVEAAAREPWASIRAERQPDITVHTIDWQHVRDGAASIARAAEILAIGLTAQPRTPELRVLLDGFGSEGRAYLIGSGSRDEAFRHDLSDGVRIACDGVVLDDELMAHVRPHVVTIADPIFHFGPSTYAQRFQRVLVERAHTYDFAVVTTQRYQPLLQAHLPQLADRIYGVRQGPATWWDNFDLRTHAAVRGYPNVLPMLMLPLAASMAPWIGLIGFERRAMNGEGLQHHDSTPELDEELLEVRLVHPGSFTADHASGDAADLATIERLLSQLEERGHRVQCLGSSDIPALRRRSAHPPVRGRASLISLTPDWIGDSGHFGAFERRVHRTAEEMGISHVALASAGLDPIAAWQLPAFSEATFFSSAANRHSPVGERFEDELRDALAGLDLDPGSTVFMYTADAWHVVALLSVAVDRPELRFVANLMRAHGWIQDALAGHDAWATEMVELLRSSLAAASGRNVVVTVDSEALARDVESLTGHRVPVWPMIALTNARQASAVRGERNGTHVVSPTAKGLADLMTLARRQADRIASGDLRLTARWPPHAEPDLVRVAERLEAMGVDFARGTFTDDGFADFVGSADIAFIPYRLRPFRTRTSGVIIDALMAGTPVVTVRGTWGGDLVERYGAGATYQESDPVEMDGALQRVIARLDDYRTRVAAVRDALAQEHAPERLVEFLRRAATQSQPPRTEAVDRVRAQAAQLRRLHRWHLATYDSARVSSEIARDDTHRRVEHLRYEVQRLRREWRPPESTTPA